MGDTNIKARRRGQTWVEATSLIRPGIANSGWPSPGHTAFLGQFIQAVAAYGTSLRVENPARQVQLVRDPDPRVLVDDSSGHFMHVCRASVRKRSAAHSAAQS
jgi:hypothetical protein